MNKPIRAHAISPLLILLSLTGCDGTSDADPAPNPQDEFWANLSSHCGKAYAGTLVSNDEADTDFANAALIMHVSECSDTRIAIPFHVELNSEWDRSRTWLITRNEAGGLRLKHDHRHADGESDAVNMYGGDTATGGTATTQDFRVDAESIALFEREKLTASVTNVWTVEIAPADSEKPIFAYQLRRTVEDGAPEDRHFRVEFDLTQATDAPPHAWGWE